MYGMRRSEVIEVGGGEAHSLLVEEAGNVSELSAKLFTLLRLRGGGACSLGADSDFW